MKPKILIVVFLLCVSVFVFSGNTTLGIKSGASMAVGSSKANFQYGGSLDLNLDYQFSPLFFSRLVLGFDVLPINLVQDNLSVFSLGLAAGLHFQILPFMGVKVYGGGGYYLGMIDPATTGSDPFVSAGLGVDFKLSSSLTLGAGMLYKNLLITATGSSSPSLYQGIGAFISGTIRFGEASAPKVRFKEIYTDPIFPIFFTHYEQHPFGTLIVENDSDNPIENAKVSVFIPQYMDKPRVSAEIAELEPGKSVNVPLSALFTDKILTVTEGAKVSMEITLDYMYGGKENKEKKVATVEVLYRNAMVWDDDRKAASFVTAKDPAVLKFAKNVVSTLRENGSYSVNKNIMYAMGLFEALGQYGISYIIDPSSSYLEKSKSDKALDYLQFPVQTLNYKAGDCDDLSILYSALLESIGIETAFITIPGHIYMAFSTNIKKTEAEKFFTSVNDLVFIDDKAWVPVEITLMQDGFIKAWRVGAKEWRENSKKNTSRFYKMHESWALYAPVGSPNESEDINSPDMGKLAERYRKQYNLFVENEIHDKVKYLKEKIRQSANKKKYQNRLGVIYAKYGFLHEAELQLQAAVKGGYATSMVNLANIYFLQGKYSDALVYYKMALRRLPDKVSVLVGLAQTHYKLEQQEEVNSIYMEIEQKNPDVADKYAFLVSGGGGSSRAASANDMEVFSWEEE